MQRQHEFDTHADVEVWVAIKPSGQEGMTPSGYRGGPPLLWRQRAGRLALAAALTSEPPNTDGL